MISKINAERLGKINPIQTHPHPIGSNISCVILGNIYTLHMFMYVSFKTVYCCEYLENDFEVGEWKTFYRNLSNIKITYLGNMEQIYFYYYYYFEIE